MAIGVSEMKSPNFALACSIMDADLLIQLFFFYADERQFPKQDKIKTRAKKTTVGYNLWACGEAIFMFISNKK